MHFGFINVALLDIFSDHRHASATHVAVFRVVSARIQIYLYCVGFSPQLK
jgi:hypothetical protein